MYPFKSAATMIQRIFWIVLNVECWCAARPWSCRGELLKVEMGERKAS